MSRILHVAAAQMGPVQRDHTRADVVERLIVMLREAADRGADLVVFPELALTTFFPRWWFDHQHEIDAFFETEMPGPDTKPLFDEARDLGVGFSLGYAELTHVETPEHPEGETRRYNTMILVDQHGPRSSTATTRCTCPGTPTSSRGGSSSTSSRATSTPGPRASSPSGPSAGIVGQLICNDRRWPETYRVLGLQGVELIMIGYNTPIHYAPDPDQDRLAGFHNNLVMASGAYQNGTWVVGVAKGGLEEGVDSLAESQIIAPSGEVVAQAVTNGDEVIVAACDLDACDKYKRTLFDFERYRMIEHYDRITSQRGVDRSPPTGPTRKAEPAATTDQGGGHDRHRRDRHHLLPQRATGRGPGHPPATCSRPCARSSASPRPRTAARRRASAAAARCCSTARRS